jgi:hypothetical protein
MAQSEDRIPDDFDFAFEDGCMVVVDGEWEPIDMELMKKFLVSIYTVDGIDKNGDIYLDGEKHSRFKGRFKYSEYDLAGYLSRRDWWKFSKMQSKNKRAKAT